MPGTGSSICVASNRNFATPSSQARRMAAVTCGTPSSSVCAPLMRKTAIAPATSNEVSRMRGYVESRSRPDARRVAAAQSMRRELPQVSGSTQLRVLAAAPIVAAEHALLRVARALAFDAQPHAGHGLAARRRNRRAAFGATFQARAFAAPAARARDRVG